VACFVCVSSGHLWGQGVASAQGQQVGVDTLLYGHDELYAVASVVQHKDQFKAVWKRLHELKRWAVTELVISQTGVAVAQWVEADLGHKVIQGIADFKDNEQAHVSQIETLSLQVLDALLHQGTYGGTLDMCNRSLITNDDHVEPPVWAFVGEIGDTWVGGRCRGACSGR